MVLESIPVLGEKVGNTLEKSSVFFVFVLFFLQRGKQTSTVTAIQDSELLFNLNCTFLDCRKK